MCGKANKIISLDSLCPNARAKRVVNGWTPLPFAFPWQGVLFLDNQHYCGVFLIVKNSEDTSTQWIATATHCFYETIPIVSKFKYIRSRNYIVLIDLQCTL